MWIFRLDGAGAGAVDGMAAAWTLVYRLRVLML